MQNWMWLVVGLTSGGLVVGILALFLGFSIYVGISVGVTAIVLGHVARSGIKRSQGRTGGGGMAIAGIIMGYLGIVSAVLMLGVSHGYRSIITRGRSTKMEGNIISVTTGKDFLGYQTDYYDVQSSTDGMVKVKFNHGEAVVQGTKTQRAQPALQLPPQTSDKGFFRIVYLIRVSQHDHDMVLLASTQKDSLHDLTNSVVTDGLNNCRVSKDSSCAGIPKGVGFILEEKVRKNGQTQWISAR